MKKKRNIAYSGDFFIFGGGGGGGAFWSFLTNHEIKRQFCFFWTNVYTREFLIRVDKCLINNFVKQLVFDGGCSII